MRWRREIEAEQPGDQPERARYQRQRQHGDEEPARQGGEARRGVDAQGHATKARVVTT